MSTNDDSASRQGRRADQGSRGPGMRAERDERWEQSSPRDRAAADRYAGASDRYACTANKHPATDPYADAYGHSSAAEYR